MGRRLSTGHENVRRESDHDQGQGPDLLCGGRRPFVDQPGDLDGAEAGRVDERVVACHEAKSRGEQEEDRRSGDQHRFAHV